MFLINKMFLHCFFQLSVSPIAKSHLQVDRFFFARQTIQLAMLIVWFALQGKKVQPEDGS
jgi:hypothetical protein